MELKESQPTSFYRISASHSRALTTRKGLTGTYESEQGVNQVVFLSY